MIGVGVTGSVCLCVWGGGHETVCAVGEGGRAPGYVGGEMVCTSASTRMWTWCRGVVCVPPNTGVWGWGEWSGQSILQELEGCRCPICTVGGSSLGAAQQLT
jgi:hypothetical protein